jgi:hypothetical protein
MQTLPPEIRNVDEKYAAALARAEQVNVDLELKREVSRAAQRAAAAAQQRLTTEREKLVVAQRNLTDAMRAGLPPKDLQQEVAGHLANISSLEQLLVEANQAAVDADKELYKASAPITSAEAAVRQARFEQLTVQLAAAIVPAIPLARELDRLSHGLGIGLSESGYVFDFSRPQISRYLVEDDGSLRFYLR